MNTNNDVHGHNAPMNHEGHDRHPLGAVFDAKGSRRHASHLAHDLSLATLEQAEKAVGGILAVPATLALGAAAGVMFVAAVVEGGFEIVGTGITDVGRRIGRHPHA